MLDWIEDNFPGGLGGALLIFSALLIAVFVVGAVQEEREWDSFKVAHQCKVVAKVDGSSSTAIGFSTSGNMVVTPVYTPGKTGWLCDDGITYYK